MNNCEAASQITFVSAHTHISVSECQTPRAQWKTNMTVTVDLR